VPKPFLPHNAALRQWPPRVAGTLLTTRVLAVLELQGETTVLRTELAEARRRCKSLEKANQWLVSSRCECVAARISRWACQERRQDGRDGRGAPSIGGAAPCGAPEIETSVASELMRSLTAREQALEADNESLRLQVRQLERDLAEGSSALDELRTKVCAGAR
jgi:hypothetical protein